VFGYEGSAYVGVMVADIIDWKAHKRGTGTIPSIRFARIDFGPGVDQQKRKIIRSLVEEFGSDMNGLLSI
jgi:hypothetical protein